jgi:hypothetical protein
VLAAAITLPAAADEPDKLGGEAASSIMTDFAGTHDQLFGTAQAAIVSRSQAEDDPTKPKKEKQK